MIERINKSNIRLAVNSGGVRHRGLGGVRYTVDGRGLVGNTNTRGYVLYSAWD